MSSFTIIVQDQEVQALLRKLQDRGKNMEFVLDTIGTAIVERTKRRFETSTGPDGGKWKDNSPAYLKILNDRLDASHRKKDGSLNAKGRAVKANKKPLIDTRELMDGINHSVSANVLTVFTSAPTAPYAAIEQFGGKAGKGHKVTIPARPFMPVLPNGTLYPQEQSEILKALNSYLMDGL